MSTTTAAVEVTTSKTPVPLTTEARAKCLACGQWATVSTGFDAMEAEMEDIDRIAARDRRTAIDMARLCTHRPGMLGSAND